MSTFIAKVVAVLVWIILFIASGYVWGYRNGQIDALSGEAIYELQERPNGEIRWEKVYD